MKSTSSIINLVKLIIFPYFRKHLLKVMLSIFGVALGVAVFIAIRSASFSAQQTMKNFIMSISINADLQITYGRDGFDESYYKRIKQVKGVKKISPFITKKTRMRKGNRYTSVLVIGLDITKENYSHKNSQSNMDVGKFISLPNQIIVSETFLKEHDLTKDSTVYIITAKGEVAFQIAGIMKSGSSLLSKHSELIIIDFFSAQYHFEKKNLIERLDIEIDKSFTVKEVKANLNRELGNALIIKTMNESSNQSDKLYKSFSLNLTVVSLISLLVGMYLIFNTINTSILHQRKEIGILRALGVTKKNVLIVFSLEGVIIGIIGSTIGIFLGWLLAHVSVEIFTQSLTKYYLITNVKTAYITPLYILFGFLIGVGMTLVSSFFPALAAIKIAPIDTIRSTSYDNIKKLKLNYFTITGFVILVIALFTSQIKPIFDIPFFGFLSNLLIILGLSF
ncbi:MAG: FtsX-like permease family protein, partial [Spirochaetota bacterium]|nr:FtsX-like permease family protein [Spirochaetota bacterium]